MQTEKAKSSHFDRTRGDKNQIFPTLESLGQPCLYLNLKKNTFLLKKLAIYGLKKIIFEIIAILNHFITL